MYTRKPIFYEGLSRKYVHITEKKNTKKRIDNAKAFGHSIGINSSADTKGGEIMDENVGYLKAKCNALIDRAMLLEKQSCQLDQDIRDLMARKSEIEQREVVARTQPENREPEENCLVPVIKTPAFPPDIEEDPSDAQSGIESMIPYDRMYDMIKMLSTQMETTPREEIVIRQLSTGGKVLELIADVIGKLFRGAGIVILMLLVSLAVTVLLNGSMRQTLIDFMQNCIG